MEDFFSVEMLSEKFLLLKFIANDFYYKNVLEMIFTIKMHCKWFLL